MEKQHAYMTSDAFGVGHVSLWSDISPSGHPSGYDYLKITNLF